MKLDLTGMYHGPRFTLFGLLNQVAIMPGLYGIICFLLTYEIHKQDIFEGKRHRAQRAHRPTRPTQVPPLVPAGDPPSDNTWTPN